MTLIEVQERAKRMGIEIGNKGRAELIQNIQQREGYAPCFGYSNGHCLHKDCCWRQDCLRIISCVKALHIIEVIE
jgi:hypothetical protein